MHISVVLSVCNCSISVYAIFFLYLAATFIVNEAISCLFPTAEREEMISCVYVSRDDERVAVTFSRPVNVSCFIHSY